ncbi:MAG TPA: hemolysin III family protein, partial [Candidatus Deferrimicrobium sp.]|nr:hemolysin III family protein [Candidatus Deferrimicrobium sp.]
MNSNTPLGDAVDEVSDVARAAVAFVKPRLRGVLHEAAFPLSLLGGAWAILHAPEGNARTSTAVYAATLSTCLGVSALYHRGHWSAGVKGWLRRLD